MQDIASFFLKDHPNWAAAALLLWVQYVIAKQYPRVLTPLTLTFQACALVCLVYLIGYNGALSELPYAARSCSFASDNGSTAKLSDAIGSMKGDTNLWFALLLLSSAGAAFFPWLEQHRKEPQT